MAERVKRPQRARNKLEVRQLRRDDFPQLQALQTLCLDSIPGWTETAFIDQVKRFPEGQICITFEDRLVACSSTLIIDRSDLQGQHSFEELVPGGMLENHDPDGDTLYGIDICVDPRFRGLRLARRLYDARQRLTREKNLRSMLIAGRMPGFAKFKGKLTPKQYLARVAKGKLRDQVITAQMANGFQIEYIISGYLPSDRPSGGNAVLMEWSNPDFVARRRGKRKDIQDVRVSAVQYQMRPVSSFEDFEQQCEFFVDTASDYRCDFICFPELLTNQLLSLVGPGQPVECARRLGQFTERYQAMFTRLAIKYNINIIGGTHIVSEGDLLFNDAYLFRRDGSYATQRKLHITPSEARWWGISPGDKFQVFDTDCGPISILICYDVEFPELARLARAKGAQIIFVPFNTDIRPAYLRVRNCAQARCIENNVYCVLSGPIGNLPEVEGTDIHYAQACILTPNDISFSRDGIGAEATPNVETLLVHEIDVSLLRWNLTHGSVRTWLDRRTDLYRLLDQSGEPV
ncbi:MAG: bifunctional GNAT family N-acetyltransferase/carbon-nitrogen hydrolase family protein [Planctomycetota bacterium]|nr:bifunctional GNAT family N-acetyltransferase/carbon-nitrogen hydrolase family protein [Planctomycetota bacterium]